MKAAVLASLVVVLPIACVAFVEAPVEMPDLLPCADDGTCEQAGYVCGYFSAPITVNGVELSPCVPERCQFGTICDPGCNCGCEGCLDGELCDVQHSSEEMRASGEACVPASCYVDEQGEFICGGPPECLSC